jgi:hypothetical protein
MDQETTQMMSSLTSRVLVVCSQTPDDREPGAPDQQKPGTPDRQESGAAENQAAGGATRCWRLAEALAGSHDVILALPTVSQFFHEQFAVVFYNHRNIGMMASDSDVVVCDAAVTALYHKLLDAGKPVVADLTGLTAPNEEAQATGSNLEEVLGTADFFICPSEEDRRQWLPVLERAGRLNPHTLEGDSGLRRLIEVVRPVDRMQPLIDYCGVPRFARDRGTGFSRAGLPEEEKREARMVWSRFKAAIKRKISGREQK